LEGESLRKSDGHRLPRALVAVLLAALSAAGCAKAPVVEPPPPPPVNVVVELRATPDGNPDAAGRASPLTVRVFQLTEDGAFSKAEFFALWEQEAATLAATVVGRHETVLAPGGTAEIRFQLDPKIRVVGVAAAYRDFRKARWRTSAAIPEQPAPGSTIRLQVTADSQAVTAQWQ
jgi:type VI secretion system protein VasD